MYNATLVCGLLLPRYVVKKCCQGDGHIENFGDEDYTEVYAQVHETARSSLETAFPGVIIFDPVPKTATTPGWILGDNSTPSRGRYTLYFLYL